MVAELAVAVELEKVLLGVTVVAHRALMETFLEVLVLKETVAVTHLTTVITVVAVDMALLAVITEGKAVLLETVVVSVETSHLVLLVVLAMLLAAVVREALLIAGSTTTVVEVKAVVEQVDLDKTMRLTPAVLVHPILEAVAVEVAEPIQMEVESEETAALV